MVLLSNCQHRPAGSTVDSGRELIVEVDPTFNKMNRPINSHPQASLNIMLVTESYPPEISGVASYIATLSRELVARGCRVSVVTLRHGAEPERETSREGIRVYRLRGIFQNLPFIYRNPGTRHHPPLPDPWLSRRLDPVIAAEKPDLIHSQGRILYSLIGLKRKFGIPLINTLHGYDLFCPTTLLINQNQPCRKYLGLHCVRCGLAHYGALKSAACCAGLSLNKDLLRAVDHTMAVSSFVKETYCRALGLPDDSITVMPDFFTLEPEEPVTAGKSGLPEDFILFAGFLWPPKGVEVLLEAYRQLETRTSLVLIGGRHINYPYTGSERIRVIHNAPHNLVMEAMRRSRFTVVPSLMPEPFGIVAIEAMSCKKAVVASHTGGLKDIVADRESGILTAPGKVEELRAALGFLLQNPHTAESMGQKGYARFQQHYTTETVVPRIMAEYRRLLER